MRRLMALGAVAVVATLAACSDLTIDAAVDQIAFPIDSASFRKEIMPVLKATCAASGACHLGPNRPNAAVQLDLSDDSTAYANLVNVPSQGRPVPPIMRVRPFQADSSFLYLVLRDTASIRLGYFRMPVAQFVLPYATRETIKNWINKGALYN
jgi:hypothetical protein